MALAATRDNAERSDRCCDWSRHSEAVPGSLAPRLLGAAVGVPGAVARSLGTTTLLQVGAAALRGTPVVAGGVEYTLPEGTILAALLAL